MKEGANNSRSLEVLHELVRALARTKLQPRDCDLRMTEGQSFRFKTVRLYSFNCILPIKKITFLHLMVK